MSGAGSKERVLQLDGLRGLAIILVFLNHLSLGPLYQITPPLLRPWLSGINSSGVVGVCILFLLSGYLMASLYPVVRSKLDFWQKRYTRIFPALIIMCLGLSYIRANSEALTERDIFRSILILVIGGGVIWKIFQHLPGRKQLGKIIFWAFLLFQVVIAGAYLVIQAQVPASVFYMLWPESYRQALYFLVNTTLTLPLGRYVPQLDGVYWSLATEVFFYWLYPILFLPIVSFFKTRKNKYLTWFLLAASFPFFWGLSLIFKAYLGLHMMQIHLAVFFMLGVIIGFYPQNAVLEKLQKWAARIPSLLLILGCTLLLIGLPFTRQLLHFNSQLEMLYWSVPLTFIFAVTVSNTNGWSRFLRLPPLVWLGNYSYAIYLTHSLAISTFAVKDGPQSLTQMFEIAGSALLATLLMSYIIHYFLELPYFNKVKSVALDNKSVIPSPKIESKPRLIPLVPILILVILSLVWLAYRVPNSLTSLALSHRQHLNQLSVIRPQTLNLILPATENNLGMFIVSLRHLTDDEIKRLQLKRGDNADAALVVEIKDDQGTSLNQSTFPLYQIFESRFFTLGFPVQTTSKGKNYTLDLKVDSDKSLYYLALLDKGVTARSVYFLDKASLIKNPTSLLKLGITKITQPFTEPEVWYVLALMTPLLGSLMWLGFTSQPLKNRFKPL